MDEGLSPVRRSVRPTPSSLFLSLLSPSATHIRRCINITYLIYLSATTLPFSIPPSLLFIYLHIYTPLCRSILFILHTGTYRYKHASTGSTTLPLSPDSCLHQTHCLFRKHPGCVAPPELLQPQVTASDRSHKRSRAESTARDRPSLTPPDSALFRARQC